jgi:hypothetical protein
MEKAIAGHFACASRPKRPRTKDDDEDDWNMTLNRYRHFVPGSDQPVPLGQKDIRPSKTRMK